MTTAALGALPFAAGSRATTIEEALLSRRSVRAFKKDPVPRAVLEEILSLSSRSPSVEAYTTKGEAAFEPPYNYYPVKWRDPYLARRRKVGWDLYGILGLTRDDKAGMAAQHARNFKFFDAPVGLIFTLDTDLELGSWLDYGMFLENLMLAARGKGLDTCPQAAISNAHHVVRAELQIPDTEQIVCGMSLGYADPDAVENKLVTVREPVAGFAQFLGFE